MKIKLLKSLLNLLIAGTIILYSKQVICQPTVALNNAHKEIWRRFIDQNNILIDYADFNGIYPRPTSEEFRENKPNALAWWTPTENGSMFNGLYLDGICRRWIFFKKKEDKMKAKRLVKGLLLLASAGDTPGVICRSVATDSKTPPAMGSNDQTSPWFYGLWRYIYSGLPDKKEKKMIITKMLEVANVLKSLDWQLPTNSYSPSKYRNSLAGFEWESAPRLLFVLKAMHYLTGDEQWNKLYRVAAMEKGGESNRSRVEICAYGMYFDKNKVNRWTGVTSTVDLLALWEMETDPSLKKSYSDGLNASARSAASGLELWKKFDNNDDKYMMLDWRTLNQWWKPQYSLQDALDVAQKQLIELDKLSPRRPQELYNVRESIWMSWIITMATDRNLIDQHRKEILSAIDYFQYDKLYYSQFFPVESVWYRLQESKK